MTLTALDGKEVMAILTVPILTKFTEVIDFYKGSALISLFDCVGTLSTHCTNLNDHLGILMPLLAKKWVQFRNDDRRLLPLMECFEEVARKIGPAAAEHFQPVFTRCVEIIMQNSSGDGWSVDFLIRSLNLISAIVTSVGDLAVSLI